MSFRAWGLLLCFCTAFCGGAWLGSHQANAAWALRWHQRDIDDANALAARNASARAEEQRRQRKINEIEAQSNSKISAAVVDAERVRAVADELHDKTEKLTARLAASERACRTATTSARAPDGSGSKLLAELFRRADERAGELAAVADEARIRGLTCEAAYDVLLQELK